MDKDYKEVRVPESKVTSYYEMGSSTGMQHLLQENGFDTSKPVEVYRDYLKREYVIKQKVT